MFDTLVRYNGWLNNNGAEQNFISWFWSVVIKLLFAHMERKYLRVVWLFWPQLKLQESVSGVMYNQNRKRQTTYQNHRFVVSEKLLKRKQLMKQEDQRYTLGNKVLTWCKCDRKGSNHKIEVTFWTLLLGTC